MASKMNSNQWIALECLIVLAVLGVLSFFRKPEYEFGVGLIVGAIISGFNNSLGVQSGSRMPEQAGDAKPGQASKTESTIKTTTQAPPEELK